MNDKGGTLSSTSQTGIRSIRNLLLTSLFAQESAGLLKHHSSNFKINLKIHNYETQQSGNLQVPRGNEKLNRSN